MLCLFYWVSMQLGLKHTERNPLEDTKRVVEQLRKNGTVDNLFSQVCCCSAVLSQHLPSEAYQCCKESALTVKYNVTYNQILLLHLQALQQLFQSVSSRAALLLHARSTYISNCSTAAFTDNLALSQALQLVKQQHYMSSDSL